MFRKEKKAILMNNTLELILAAVGIAILVFFVLSKIFSNSGADQEAQSVKRLADKVEKISEIVHEDENFNLVVRGVYSLDNNYFLTGWSKSSLDRPNKCYFNSCICVCKSDCQKDGICRKVSSDVEMRNYGVEYVSPSYVPETGVVRDTYREKITSKIVLPSNLMELNFRRTENKLVISYYEKEYLQNIGKIYTDE